MTSRSYSPGNSCDRPLLSSQECDRILGSSGRKEEILSIKDVAHLQETTMIIDTIVKTTIRSFRMFIDSGIPRDNAVVLASRITDVLSDLLLKPGRGNR